MCFLHIDWGLISLPHTRWILIWVLTLTVSQSQIGTYCPLLCLCWGISSLLMSRTGVAACCSTLYRTRSLCFTSLSDHKLSIFTVLVGACNPRAACKWELQGFTDFYYLCVKYTPQAAWKVRKGSGDMESEQSEFIQWRVLWCHCKSGCAQTNDCEIEQVISQCSS